MVAPAPRGSGRARSRWSPCGNRWSSRPWSASALISGRLTRPGSPWSAIGLKARLPRAAACCRRARAARRSGAGRAQRSLAGVGGVAEVGDPHQLDHRLGLGQLRDAEQAHRRIVAAEVLPPRLAEFGSESGRRRTSVTNTCSETRSSWLPAGRAQRSDQVGGGGVELLGEGLAGADLAGEVDGVAGLDGVGEAPRLAELGRVDDLVGVTGRSSPVCGPRSRRRRTRRSRRCASAAPG